MTAAIGITEEMVEAGARAAAAENGDDFDALPKSKADWTANHGQFGGRFRDVNEPRQGDYLDMARACLTAALAETHVAVPTSAIAWLMGEAPDADGKWFGECADAARSETGKYPRKYWWRSKFRAMIENPHDPSGVISDGVKPDSEMQGRLPRGDSTGLGG